MEGVADHQGRLMPKMRDKTVHCETCGGRSDITANLDTGKITKITLPTSCKWPNLCSRKFVEGIFDRPFGSRIIQNKFGGEP